MGLHHSLHGSVHSRSPSVLSHYSGQKRVYSPRSSLSPCNPHMQSALIDDVDGETCSAMHYQPKQPKTLLVLNQGGAGETEADLWYQAQQAADTLPNTQTGHRHPNWSQAPKLQNQT